MEENGMIDPVELIKAVQQARRKSFVMGIVFGITATYMIKRIYRETDV